MKSMSYLASGMFPALVCLLLIFPQGPLAQPIPLPEPFSKAPKEANTGLYIVQFSDPPLASYGGGVAGLSPTTPEAVGAKRLNVENPAGKAYSNYLARKREEFMQKMTGPLRKTLSPQRVYTAAFNGMAVELSAEEARIAASLPGVENVVKDSSQSLQTDTAPRWIGADTVWDGLSAKGEGIVIGIIDSGINPANPSFADVGDDGYDHVNPRGVFYGVCDSSDPDYAPGFCSDKLIGAYDFTPAVEGNPATPLDASGHGSHTASTAAGNVVQPATLAPPTITFDRNISGVAPHANIVSYRACYPESVGKCPVSALLASIDQAVIDGVDVINYSIGGDPKDPWTAPEAQAFLAARQAGIVVVVSAGNNGPDPQTQGSPAEAPWLISVGASTHDRDFKNSLVDFSNSGGPSLDDIKGQGVTSDYGPAPIVYAGDPPYSDPLCGEAKPGTWTNGEIVVCDRGEFGRVEKGKNVLDSGAGGYVLANDEPSAASVNADGHELPAVHVSFGDGVALKAWLDASTDPMATISGATVEAGVGDVMASFSSRGPNSQVGDIVKPDVTAPGMNILAAGGTDTDEPYGVEVWEMMSGTSMSSPVVAGAAALLKELHPDWSPAEIQSALMTTSRSGGVVKEDGATDADPFERGAGSVDASAAANAGFVLDETYEDYVAANPSNGGDPAALNIPSFGKETAIVDQSWSRTLKSTQDTTVQWDVSVVNPPGVVLSASPSSFNLGGGASRAVSVIADLASAEFDTWLFGEVLFEPATAEIPTARMPVAIKSVRSNLPDRLVISSLETSGVRVIEDVKAIEITQLQADSYGLVQGTLYSENIVQDPTPSSLTNPWPPDPAVDGVFKTGYITVGANAERLVAEIIQTTSPNINMYVYYYGTQSWVCNAYSAGSEEYCDIRAPEAGNYLVVVQNYEATDPSGKTADDVDFAVAVVPADDSQNLEVGISGGTTAMAAGQLFDLELAWSTSGPDTHWYGATDLGTDPGSAGNLGTMAIDLYVGCTNGDVKISGTGAIYPGPLQDVYENDAEDGDILLLHASNWSERKFVENVNFNREDNISIRLEGGYDCQYTTNLSDMTYINGSLTVSRGSVVVESVGIASAGR